MTDSSTERDYSLVTRRFIDKNKLVIFRLNEHWNMRKPDPRAQGLAAAMAWTSTRPATMICTMKIVRAHV